MFRRCAPCVILSPIPAAGAEIMGGRQPAPDVWPTRRTDLYVTSVHIENMRCFAEADLKLRHPDLQDQAQPTLNLPNINLLLGNNGGGKTTVLKAIALAALAPVMARSSGYKPYRL